MQLLRRFTNERVGQLLQDIESTLRSVLLSVFRRLGQEQVQRILEGRQSEREFMATELNQALLGWAQAKGGRELREDLNSVLVERRKNFKAGNTLWAKVTSMMAGDREREEVAMMPDHLRCVDYLTFGELSDLFVEVLEHTFTGVQVTGAIGKQLVGRWRENLAKIQRMRNRAAHLRNIHFQDMEDMIRTIMSMRSDLLRYAGPG